VKRTVTRAAAADPGAALLPIAKDGLAALASALESKLAGIIAARSGAA
jgi:hypothetical protein